MTRGDIGRRLWGRPIKPMAIGMILALASVTLNGIAIAVGMQPLISPSGNDLLIGVMSGVALTLMVGSWLVSSQRAFEWSLLAVVGAFVSRAAFVQLVEEYPLQGVLPFSIALMAAGAYVVERADKARWVSGD